MRFPIAVFVIAASAALAGPASAQSNMFDTLKKAVTGATGSNDGGGAAGNALPYDDIVAGLKEALRVGVERVVGQVGAVDGFNADPAIHIPLPPSLRDAQATLRKFGLSSLADEVELKLNRGAEAAAPKAKELIWKAIRDMTLDDARRIYDGPEDAATQYFRKVATPELRTTIRPVVDQSLREVGAVAAYDDLTRQYSAIPFVPDLKGDLSAHATEKAIDGIFHYLAREEAAIRQDPAKRTTEILTRVFGS